MQKERPPFTGLERTAAALALWALAMVPLSTNVAQSALFYRRFYLFVAIWTCAAVSHQRAQAPRTHARRLPRRRPDHVPARSGASSCSPTAEACSAIAWTSPSTR
jgi:hypothetical protein